MTNVGRWIVLGVGSVEHSERHWNAPLGAAGVIVDVVSTSRARL